MERESTPLWLSTKQFGIRHWISFRGANKMVYPKKLNENGSRHKIRVKQRTSVRNLNCSSCSYLTKIPCSRNNKWGNADTPRLQCQWHHWAKLFSDCNTCFYLVCFSKRQKYLKYNLMETEFEVIYQN